MAADALHSSHGGLLEGALASSILLFFSKFYLFIFRERGRKGEREGEKHPCERETFIGCLLQAPNQGPGLQPRPVP